MSGKRLAALAAFCIVMFGAAGVAWAGAASGDSFRVGSQEFSYTQPDGFVEVTAGEHSALYEDFLAAVRGLMPEQLNIVRYFVSDENHRLMLEEGEAPMSELISIIVLTNLPDQPFTQKEFREISAYLTPDRIEQHAAQNSERVVRKMTEDYDTDIGVSLSSSPTVLADTDSLFSIGISMRMQDDVEEVEIAEITSVVYLGGRVFMVQQCRDIHSPADMAEFTAGYRATLAALDFRPLHPSGLPDNSQSQAEEEEGMSTAGMVVLGAVIFLAVLALFILVVRRILRPRPQG